jgi:PAS domain-containing protein
MAYAAAGAAALFATWLRRLLDPLLGADFPFPTLFVAVLAIAWWAGFGPALLALVLGSLSATFFLLPSPAAWPVLGADQQLALGRFFIAGLAVALLGGALRRASGRADAVITDGRVERDQLRVALDHVGDGVIVADAQGRVCSLNRLAERLTGWHAEQARGQPLDRIFRIMNETTGTIVQSPLVSVLRARQPVALAEGHGADHGRRSAPADRRYRGADPERGHH